MSASPRQLFTCAALALGVLSLALAAPAPAAFTTVYTQNFDDGSAPDFIAPGVTTVGGIDGWSAYDTDPDSLFGDPGRIYGRMGPGTFASIGAVQTITLTGLPAHSQIQVTVDVIPRAGWDGNNSPDVFRIWHTTDDTITWSTDLIHVTFFQPSLGTGTAVHSWPTTVAPPTPYPANAVPGPNYRGNAGDESEWSAVTVAGSHVTGTLVLGFRVHIDSGEVLMLDNLIIAVNEPEEQALAVPEPAALGALGLVVLAWRRRSR